MEPENQVDAGSETSGEQAVDTTATAQADATTATDTSATDTAQATDASADAGGASSETTVKAGDSCVCPDGRTGTVHSYDEGLICIPNADQG
jgi:hypothetical protein